MIYEIKINGEWKRVAEWIFRSWSGERLLNGVLYRGPVYMLGSNSIHSGAKIK